MSQRQRNQEIYQRLCKVIPGGVSSPVRAFKNVEQTPLVAACASQDLLTDVDGNSYIDLCGSWGALILGHAHPEVLRAVTSRMQRGTSFGCTTELEGHLAQMVSELYPGAEKVRFVSSGTEATMSAARLARGFTRKPLVAKFSGHFHGHADQFLVQAGSGATLLTPSSSSGGVPDEMVKNTLCLPFNDVQGCQDILSHPSVKGRLAAILLEPVAGNMGVVPASLPFLHFLREYTLVHEALLIFDEVITGFRLGLGGAAGRVGITPDLACFGKILGGGFPLAAFAGQAEIMDHLAPQGPVYQSGTLSGNPVAVQAGLTTLEILRRTPDFYQELQGKADLITVPVRAALQKLDAPACLQQVGSMFTLFFGKTAVTSHHHIPSLDVARFNRLFSYLFERGIYIPPSQYEAWFVSAAHTDEHLLAVRDAILEFLHQEFAPSSILSSCNTVAEGLAVG